MQNKLKLHRLKNREAMCRGSLAWLGRQTHNLEFARGKRLQPEVAGSNPAPGTTFALCAFLVGHSLIEFLGKKQILFMVLIFE
jgi:hypothetical protein